MMMLVWSVIQRRYDGRTLVLYAERGHWGWADDGASGFTSDEQARDAALELGLTDPFDVIRVLAPAEKVPPPPSPMFLG